MSFHHFLTTILITFFCGQVYAAELPEEAQKMLADLGTPDVQQQNNGKLFRCVFGGTKRVTVSLLGNATIFTADYNNCRETGSTRDGHYEIMVQNGEIIGSKAERSINGELFDAVRDSDTAKVRKLIASKADVNYSESISGENHRSIDGWTALMWASSNGNNEIMPLLLKAGAWVNFMNSDVVNALWIASSNGCLEAVKVLLKNKAYINNRNYEDVTPLMAAAMRGHYDVVSCLLDAKASVNLVHKEGDSALMFALAGRHTRVAQRLIDAGADINIRNKYGVTALMIAIAEGNEGIALELLDKKADLAVKTDSGMTALDIAIAKGNSKIAEMIRQAQASR